jgi:hypothetical protein
VFLRVSWNSGDRPEQVRQNIIATEQGHKNLHSAGIDQSYEMRSQASSHVTDMGHLELFRLEPLDQRLPLFRALGHEAEHYRYRPHRGLER